MNSEWVLEAIEIVSFAWLVANVVRNRRNNSMFLYPCILLPQSVEVDAAGNWVCEDFLVTNYLGKQLLRQT